MAMKKGMSTIIMVFIIIVVSLAAISWYQANVQTGSEQQALLNTQSAFYDLGFNLNNAKLYLSESFYSSAMRGSNIAGNYSGRYPEDDPYRYWMCAGSEQAPKADLVAYTASNATNVTFKERIEELRGIHGQTYFSIDDPSCVGTGIPADVDDVPPSYNTHQSGFSIDKISTGFVEDDLERSENNINTREPIKYNRYWFMYDRLEDFVSNEDPAPYVADALSEIPDKNTETNPDQCLSDASACNYPNAYVCEGISNEATNKITEGLIEMVEELETNEDYFNGTGVTCTVEQNEAPSGNKYPGVTVTPTSTNHYTEKDGCGTGSCDLSCGTHDGDENACNNAGGCTFDSGDCTRDPSVTISGETDCEDNYDGDWSYDKTLYDCHTTWQHQFTAYVDMTLTCTDRNYKMVPDKENTHVSWNIDMSFTASSLGSGDTTSCPYQGGSVPPQGLKQCAIPDEPAAPSCDVGVTLDE